MYSLTHKHAYIHFTAKSYALPLINLFGTIRAEILLLLLPLLSLAMATEKKTRLIQNLIFFTACTLGKKPPSVTHKWYFRLKTGENESLHLGIKKMKTWMQAEGRAAPIKSI